MAFEDLMAIEWEIYHDVTEEPRHGHALGLDMGIKGKKMCVVIVPIKHVTKDAKKFTEEVKKQWEGRFKQMEFNIDKL